MAITVEHEHDADPSAVVAQLLDRAADVEQCERFERQVRATGYCRRPVRLHGQVDAVDLASGECRTVYSTEPEPDGTLLKCCGNRREAVCPSCAETYRGDAYQLVAAGLRGGKGVPESVTEHPMVFVTLTAPSSVRCTRDGSRAAGHSAAVHAVRRRCAGTGSSCRAATSTARTTSGSAS